MLRIYRQYLAGQLLFNLAGQLLFNLHPGETQKQQSKIRNGKNLELRADMGHDGIERHLRRRAEA